MSNLINAAKQTLDALGAYMGATDEEEDAKAHSLMADAFFKLKESIAEAEKQVVFKIYKPTSPRGAIPNVRDSELPWVYDQDSSSGNVASMWVTPIYTHPQPNYQKGQTD